MAEVAWRAEARPTEPLPRCDQIRCRPVARASLRRLRQKPHRLQVALRTGEGTAQAGRSCLGHEMAAADIPEAQAARGIVRPPDGARDLGGHPLARGPHMGGVGDGHGLDQAAGVGVPGVAEDLRARP